MPKPKLSAEEREERKRLSEQKRREKIRNNPVLLEEYLRKERERYVKKKDTGVVVSRSAMTASKLPSLRKKNLVSALASYKKKQKLFVRTHLKMLPMMLNMVKHQRRSQLKIILGTSCSFQ